MGAIPRGRLVKKTESLRDEHSDILTMTQGVPAKHQFILLISERNDPFRSTLYSRPANFPKRPKLAIIEMVEEKIKRIYRAIKPKL